MDIELYLLEIKEAAEKSIQHLKFELSKISTGRANPQLVKWVKVDYYGTPTSLDELANISVPEPQQLLIKPYDQSSVKDILKAINNANLGITPVDEGNQVRITFPALTTERRRELTKSLPKHSEQAKVGVRNARQDVNKSIKGDDSISEDEQKRVLEIVQKEVDKYINEISAIVKDKENELMNK
ncbi:ribosome recycling factor [Mycoplasmopsis anatis]|uniref:Ribosome-recycling factor n=2 Tax=Mycoplasmopsis anatis TaxID=171279 RepID=F9QD69_9BACT|nr:ribosome recycling factor [Mycoplasmopsis anatis]AWX70233.1 ribosome recycling factor [Mycoplasmopsis anatis]EGS29327.1 ribosome recycling factor [Mycoplasmopsis anatis 1340]MBW0594298.1 ribosome recycling factor [Mycoplasmopsis anatis]MBW0595121.1 ribosome recycling factor [Mycoplasmopsis anatis]MBW0596050.1 ribosome recycling factor [Mycoplasmopsis anatis]